MCFRVALLLRLVVVISMWDNMYYGECTCGNCGEIGLRRC